MYYFDHFFGAYKNIYLDYDYLHTVDRRDELPVRFTRLSPTGDHDIAETVAPACAEWKSQGFSDEEQEHLKRFLMDNMSALLAEAEESRGKDEHLTEVTFEVTDEELLRILRASYLLGMSPGEFVNMAIRDAIEHFEQNPEQAKELYGRGSEGQNDW
ncbi:MAG: hypothetical protein Q4B77_06485 [Coriobacteriaceae bacterium]|nr:hypothetical protein [Coriobacteriaceae bacterium]